MEILGFPHEQCSVTHVYLVNISRDFFDEIGVSLTVDTGYPRNIQHLTILVFRLMVLGIPYEAPKLNMYTKKMEMPSALGGFL